MLQAVMKWTREMANSQITCRADHHYYLFVQVHSAACMEWQYFRGTVSTYCTWACNQRYIHFEEFLAAFHLALPLAWMGIMLCLSVSVVPLTFNTSDKPQQLLSVEILFDKHLTLYTIVDFPTFLDSFHLQFQSLRMKWSDNMKIDTSTHARVLQSIDIHSGICHLARYYISQTNPIPLFYLPTTVLLPYNIPIDSLACNILPFVCSDKYFILHCCNATSWHYSLAINPAASWPMHQQGHSWCIHIHHYYSLPLPHPGKFTQCPMESVI